MTNRDEHAPVDWARVERWTTQIIARDYAEIEVAFAAPAKPQLLWNPEPEALASDKLPFLLNYWNGLKRGAAIPRFAGIDPLDMRPVLGYVMLLEPVEGDRDFRFRVFGSAIARVSEFELTGRLASELVASPAVVEFGLASYRAAFRNRAPLYTVRFTSHAHYTAAWHRLTLPLVDNDGSVARLIAASVPLSSEGTLVQ
jgi:hypothetical protein